MCGWFPLLSGFTGSYARTSGSVAGCARPVASRFLSTASAAGLLTQIGSAPYSVSKHAAVAFAEWLAVTYGDRMIGVSCLCPMGVETRLFQDGLGVPEVLAVTTASVVLTPENVADVVVDALGEGRFLILPHPRGRDVRPAPSLRS